MDKKINLWSDASVLKQLEQSLKQNQVSITSTDTVLGLLAPLTEQGFDALNKIKGGRSNKPYLVLISSADKLAHFVDQKSLTQELINALPECWPGPLTIVFKAKDNLPTFLKSAEGTVAMRCPEHKSLLKILQNFDGLFSTSANLSGQPIPQTYEEIGSDVLNQINMVVIDKGADVTKSASSTIIDASNPSHGIKVLRTGAFPIRRLKSIFGKII